MAELHEVVDHQAGALEVVVDDGVEVLPAAVPRDDHGRYADPELLEPGGAHPRCDEDQPVDLPVHQGLHGPLLALWHHAAPGDEDLLKRSWLQFISDPLNE